MDSENIIWDGFTSPIKEVAELSIYLFAFDDVYIQSEMIYYAR
jgi:hypothetical protein